MEEIDWRELADQAESEGELLLRYLTDTIAWVREVRGPDAPLVRRVLDIGSGPGVGTCELARLFPDAHVLAIDGSPAMLDRVRNRAVAHGLEGRITTHLAELPNGLDGLEPAELIWASMSLHHVGDEVAALQALGDLLEPSGLIAIAEFSEPAAPMRILPDPLDIGRPGLADRLENAESEWFASMRQGLRDTGASADLSSMLDTAGFEVLGSRLARQTFEAPLSNAARRVALGHLQRLRNQMDGRLDEDDLDALDVLINTDDPRGVMHRPDVFVASSRQIQIAQLVHRRPRR
jgi:SAM-dependent methyltransferase